MICSELSASDLNKEQYVHYFKVEVYWKSGYASLASVHFLKGFKINYKLSPNAI